MRSWKGNCGNETQNFSVQTNSQMNCLTTRKMFFLEVQNVFFSVSFSEQVETDDNIPLGYCPQK